MPGGSGSNTGWGGSPHAAGGLSDGLRRLGGGAERLSRGLIELEGGAGALQAGLAEGSAAPTRCRRLRQPASGSPRWRRRWRSAPGGCSAARPTSSNPATSSSPRSTGRRPARAAAGEAVSLEGGGQAARMLVISTHPFNTAGSREVGRLLDDAERIGSEGICAPASPAAPRP